MTASRGGPAHLTIGELSRRTGVPVKALRDYVDRGLIYSAGRSPGNYRLFDDEALWCVRVITTLRSLGLTVAEICELSIAYLAPASGPVGPALGEVLRAVRARTQTRIAELQARLERIAEYEEAFRAELGGAADFHAQDPHFRAQTP